MTEPQDRPALSDEQIIGIWREVFAASPANASVVIPFARAIAAAAPSPQGEALDAARLDYLQRTGSTVDLLLSTSADERLRFRIGGLHAAVNSDLREAIDAALRASSAADSDGGESND